MAIVVEASKREQVLRFIAEFRREKDWAPTMVEIAEGCDLASKATVSYHLDQLAGMTCSIVSLVRGASG